MPTCPRCQSEKVIRNGRIHNGKPKFACKECHYQFVEKPAKPRISDETKALIDKLLLERVSLAGIARVTGVSARWLQTYVNQKYAAVPRQVDVSAQKNDA
jgi:transposase-like protein